MTIQFTSLSLGSLIMRYYLIMAIVIGAGFSGMWYLGIIALPLLISTILGMSISWGSKKAVSRRSTRIPVKAKAKAA
ncbi:MAG: hypothetical protein AAF990_19460 [Bacteroidota bacterium]